MAPPNMGKMFARPTKTYHDTQYPAINASREGLSLKGKTVLITGGATGIGLETSRAFAQAGTSIIALLARSEGPMLSAKEQIESDYPGTKVQVFAASITDSDKVNEIVKQIGTIDILVLNAGVMHKHAPTLDIDPDAALESFQVNVIGPWNLIRAFVQLKPRDPKIERTVIYTSTGGITAPPHAGPSIYNASKSAMTYIMRCIHAEYADSGIRSFAFHPAIAYTPMARGAGYAPDALSYDSPELPAHFAVWLCSSEADFVKGRFLWAAWDVEELKKKQDVIEKNPEQLMVGHVMDKLVEATA